MKTYASKLEKAFDDDEAASVLKTKSETGDMKKEKKIQVSTKLEKLAKPQGRRRLVKPEAESDDDTEDSDEDMSMDLTTYKQKGLDKVGLPEWERTRFKTAKARAGGPSAQARTALLRRRRPLGCCRTTCAALRRSRWRSC